MANFDAIVIPGGGVRRGGALPTWVESRLERAVNRYSGEHVIPLSAGTTHRPPPVDENGFPIFESAAAAAYLLAAGIPADRILPASSSYDTIGNAFFSRMIHAEPRRFRKLLVITSDFHLDRVERTFRWVYGLKPAPIEYHLEFDGVQDPRMDEAVLRARREKERRSLEMQTRLASRLTTLPDFHQWLFTEHTAYNAGGRAFRARAVGGPVLESY